MITYLRLSLTDLCNIRCLYCLPAEGVPHLPREKILSFEEIERLVRILAGEGIRRVRLTGGEPLVRKGMVDLVRRIGQVKGIEEVLLTTNGILLKPLARGLWEGGLRKINIHLDTLSPEKFRLLTRGADIRSVFEGIEEARRVGFQPIKLNAVLQRGVNDDDVESLLSFAAERSLILRLIELMPIGPGREMMPAHFVSAGEIRQRLEKKYTLTPSLTRLGSGPAKYYDVCELGTKIGFIAPLSSPFCDRCDRIRISSDGRFQGCLAFDGEFSLRGLLRDPSMTDEEIAARLRELMGGEKEGHGGFVGEEKLQTLCMGRIGG